MIPQDMDTKKLNVLDIMDSLSKTHPIFHCELEFQFYLAWKIKEYYQDFYDIKIEYPMLKQNNGNANIDLVLIDKNNQYIPIELKYHTKKLEQNFGDFTYRLKEQGATDLLKYGYFRDISRVEYFKTQHKNFLTGYAIIITNSEKIWSTASGISNTDYQFSLKDNSIIMQGEKCWSNKTSESIKIKYPNVLIKNSYKINWINYSNFENKNGKFKYLVTKVN